MDIDIDNIDITITGNADDQEGIARDMQKYLEIALVELTRREGTICISSGEYARLDLGILDWNAEPDKKQAIQHLFSRALGETV